MLQKVMHAKLSPARECNSMYWLTVLFFEVEMGASVLIIVLYPAVLAFAGGASAEISPRWFQLFLMLDVLLWLDMFKKLLKAVLGDRHATLGYIRGQFILDIFARAPYDFLFYAGGMAISEGVVAAHHSSPVSYTHLTLPTILLV